MISISKIEYLLRPTSIYPLLRGSFRRAALRQWQRTARPPAPLEVKAQIIRHYAAKYGLRNFIETGTFFGDMLAALRNDFDALTTIELDVALAARATQRFAEEPKITVIQGDSARVLPALLATLKQPALFWLDGHFSGGVTAKGETDTPIIAELNHLFAAAQRDHVVLIDDARLFGSATEYPSLDAIETLVRTHRAEWAMTVETDLIRLEANTRQVPRAS
jgi:hypothetical protein